MGKPKAAREAGACFVYAYAAVTGLQAIHPRYVAMGMQTAVEPNASLEESTASGQLLRHRLRPLRSLDLCRPDTCLPGGGISQSPARLAL